MPFGLLGGALGLAGSLFGNSRRNNGQRDRQRLTEFNPIGINAGGISTSFNDNTLSAELSPELQAFRQNLLGQSSNFLQQPGSAFGQSGIQQALSNFNNSGIDNGTLGGLFGQLGQQFQQGNQNAGLAGQFFDNASSSLQQAGNFDSQGFAEQRLELMRGLSDRTDSRRRSDLEDRLFRQGRLGTTGGTRQFGELEESLGREDLQRQLSSLGEARTQQGFLNSLAQGNAQTGAGLFSQGQNNQGQLLQQLLGIGGFQNQQSGNRFDRALQTFGASQGAIDADIQRGLGLFGGVQGIDQQLLNAVQNSGNLGALRSQSNNQAGQAAAQRGNNSGGLIGGILGGIGGLF